MNYINWLKARIEHTIASGEIWMLDGLAIARAWAAREGVADLAEFKLGNRTKGDVEG